jgi:UDP-N-acetyl-2-amino-2-deoxyglucuronate dehydrogenase
MTERVSMALVGCGAIAEMHRYGLERSGAPIDVVATVDVDMDRARSWADRFEATPYDSLDMALDDGGFDAVDLMVPHHLHEQLATRCLEAGRHLLLEKPMAPTLDACERILATAERSGCVFMVAENAQYWPEVRTVGQLLTEGAIGEPITSRATSLIPPLPDFYGADDAWRFDAQAAGGGVAIDAGSHWIRPLRMWFGEVDEVTGATGRPYGRMASESLVRALLRFDSGIVSSLDLLLADTPFAPESLFRVTGTEGELLIEADGSVRINTRGRRLEPVGERAGYLESYSGAFIDFAAAILHGTPPEADARTSLGELRTAMALYRSVDSGRWEEVW